MDLRKCKSFNDAPSVRLGAVNFSHKLHAKARIEDRDKPADCADSMDIDVDLREIYFLIMHFLSSGPCQKTFVQLLDELLEHELLPRRYHAWYSRSGTHCGEENVEGNSFPLMYDSLVRRYSHIEKDHLVGLLKQLMLMKSPPLRCIVGRTAPGAADVPTLLGTGSFSLLPYERNKMGKKGRNVTSYLCWPHMQADQWRGLSLREIGGGFTRHHRAPSIRLACYAIAKPSAMVQNMRNLKTLRGHLNTVYCAIFDRSGRYVITGADDRLVKIWSMETAFCLAGCRGHEGDITDLSVSVNNALVASASNDFTIRVWRLPDGYPISVLRGHTGVVTAIVFCPRPSAPYQLLSSSDDGTCRLWDARYSQCCPRVYLPKPVDVTAGMNSGLPSSSTPSSTVLQSHQILCCAFNANGTVFVTGSSDTFARVWSASNPSTEDPDQTCQEIDILAGHENDVNYVQFSGCAVASRFCPSDSFNEDSTLKFKNSWISHDNIVTCSRDGSAIIWIPRSRRSHGRAGRWVRAYHLKVPPPPVPPRPARGGPRQRFRPTPRGVNMIIWSLDNRFVLAAIMDNRICVWNAIDGSLVHSLAGHTGSTYVLDVHPFNPRIAMSAGYDGKTILWDIWEGTPIRTYDITPHHQLVDGKFSPDGTSIVLSDSAGQIYLIDTGAGECQKDAKYDQFFLGDYRPLTQDTHGNVIDQETQLAPYVRNIQDPLCDSSMLPYPEPYQSMYQQRRLGALGFEWRPSSVKFSVGMDTGMGQEFHILPLPDLDVPEPLLPEYVDTLWEPENEPVNDDNDSEYNVAEEYHTDQTSHGNSTSTDADSSDEDKAVQNKRDSTRRSKQKKPVVEVELATSSGRRVKKRSLDEQGGTSSRSKRYQKARNGQNSSRRKSSKLKSSRPQRVAARNAVNSFSQISESSADEDIAEDDSASDTSDGESFLEGSPVQRRSKIPVVSEGSDDGIKPPLINCNSNINVGNKKKLVVRFSLQHRRTPPTYSDSVGQLKSQGSGASSSLRAEKESRDVDGVNSRSGDISPFARMVEKDSENCGGQPEDAAKPTEAGNEPRANVSWGKLKIRMSNSTHARAIVPTDDLRNKISLGEIEDKSASLAPSLLDHQQLDSDSGVFNKQISGDAEKSPSNSELIESGSFSIDAKRSIEPQNNSKKKPTVLKIKRNKLSGDSSSTGAGKDIMYTSLRDSLGELMPRRPSSLKGETILEVSMMGSRQDEPHIHLNGDEAYDSNTNAGLHNIEAESESPDMETDSARRTRSIRFKVGSQDIGPSNNSMDMGNYLQPGTSRGTEKSSEKDSDYFPSEGSKFVRKSKSSRIEKGGSYAEDRSSFIEQNQLHMPKKQNWLLLSEQEDGYRYIPQLGDEVVYIQQGHKDYTNLCDTPQCGPWVKYGDKIRAVEICLVEDLKYTTHSGSGDSCCQLTLKFIDCASPIAGQKFPLTLAEMNFTDFVVERTWYEAAMERNWTIKDKCLVWWKDENGQDGAWWDGRITSIIDKSSDFPECPWERYLVKYKNDTDHHRHSPWELHDPDRQWEPPTIDLRIKREIVNSFSALMHAARKDKDKYGIRKLNEVAQKLDFMNRFPVPLSMEIIKLRVDNNYYRNLKALKHDIKVMISNAESYFLKNTELLRKMKRLSSWFDKNIFGL